MVTRHSPNVLPVYQSRKWFETAGHNVVAGEYDRGPSGGRIHSRRESGDPHRHPRIRWRPKERYRSFEDDRIFPGRHVSAPGVRCFSFFRMNFSTDTRKGLHSPGSSTFTASPTVGSAGSLDGISAYCVNSAENRRCRTSFSSPICGKRSLWQSTSLGRRNSVKNS